MSEYFRKYIKKDHYPLHLYLFSHLVLNSNSKLSLSIAFNNPFSIVNTNKLKKMTGIFTGAKNSSFHKLLTKSDSTPIKKSIISGTFIKSVGKISSLKMSNDSKRRFKKKEKQKKPASIILCHWLIICLVSIPSFLKNSKEPKKDKKLYGSWNLYFLIII